LRQRAADLSISVGDSPSSCKISVMILNALRMRFARASRTGFFFGGDLGSPFEIPKMNIRERSEFEGESIEIAGSLNRHRPFKVARCRFRRLSRRNGET